MHVMIDLETFAKTPDAAFWQIGMVPFDPVAGTIGEGRKISVDPQACISAGLRYDWDTLHWWMGQPGRHSIPAPGEGLLLSEAVREVSRLFVEWGGREVWANGASFDIPIIETGFRVCRLQAPWMYYNVRCIRTLAALRPNVPRVQPEQAHDALSDAKAQAQWVVNMLKGEVQ